MKTLIISYLLLFSSWLTANDSKRWIIPSKFDKKTDNTHMVQVKYQYMPSNSFGFKYELTVPLSANNMPFLITKKKKSRFTSKKAVYQPRFQNLDKLDLSAIVETNKLYNLSKGLQIKNL